MHRFYSDALNEATQAYGTPDARFSYGRLPHGMQIILRAAGGQR
jgi:hypothetical protein